MTRTDSSTTPLEAATDTVGSHAIEVFKMLGDETRLSILLALWESYDPHSPVNALSFTKLRNRVGIRQGQRFNYHLGKLVGSFVRKTDDGYSLTQPGLQLVQSIIAGTGIERPTLDSTEIDAECRICGSATSVTYRRGRVYQVCTGCDGEAFSNEEHPAGTLVGWTFEPTGLSNRTAEEVFTASTVKALARIALRFEEICPECSGRVEWSLDVCEAHEPASDGLCPTCGRVDEILVRETCSVCKSSGQGTPGLKVMVHPAVISFFYDHGIEAGFSGDTDYEDVLRTLALAETFETEVVSTDPVRIRVTVSHEADELRLVLDEEMTVVEVLEHARG